MPTGRRSTKPTLVLDLSGKGTRGLLHRLCRSPDCPGVRTYKLMLATYFGALDSNLATAAALLVAGLHIDLVRSADQTSIVSSPSGRAATSP